MNAKIGRLIGFLAEPNNDPNDAREAFKGTDRAYCDALFELLRCHEKRAKNRAAKLIAHLAEAKPAVVYARIDDLVSLLPSNENILLWNALISIGHVAGADDTGKIEKALSRILKLLSAESMVTAANTIDCVVNIAVARPELAGKIIDPLTRIGEIERNEDCRVILTARVTKQFLLLVEKVDARQRNQLLRFAKKLAASEMERIAKPAMKLLKKLS